MKRKLIDITVLEVEGDSCKLKYLVDCGTYLRRITDVYNLSLCMLDKGFDAIDPEEFISMLNHKLRPKRKE